MSESETKQCQNCKERFTIEPSDFDFYEKIDVPPPTWCPECRYLRRLLDRNEWAFYRRKCDATGKSIISIYCEEAPFPVYNQDFWKGDEWDPLEYGRDFDFSRPFFEQYEELRQVVPHLAIVNSESVNSEYSNQAQNNRDGYMITASNGSEKCMYGNWYQAGSYFCSDCYMIKQGEMCYECINCGNCYSCAWCEDCFNCSSLWFSIDCRGCSDCFGCVGLRNKKNCWFNEQLSKEEYAKKLEEFNFTRENIAKVRKQAAELALKVPRKFYHGSRANNSSGDYLENTERAKEAFNSRESKDASYIQDAWEMEDSMDTVEILKGERSYEIQGCAFIRNSIVLRSSWSMSDCYYCDMCFSSNDCFGCFGLKQKEYCILNKQYSKEDYLDLKQKIIDHMKKIGEWGEYFPAKHSPFAYNESVAQDFFPLTKNEAKERGYQWYDAPKKDYAPTITSDKLPELIENTPESVVDEIIKCRTQESEHEVATHPSCTTAFRLIPLEIDLYRKLGIPIPDKCFPCRRTDRFTLRNPRKLWYRSCQCAGEKSDNGAYQNTSGNHPDHAQGEHCPNEFQTSYAPDRPEIIYCEECYQAEIV